MPGNIREQRMMFCRTDRMEKTKGTNLTSKCAKQGLEKKWLTKRTCIARLTNNGRGIGMGGGSHGGIKYGA